MNLARRLTAEAVGTALLLATVVGSGIMGERLVGGNVAIALLANTVATGAALVTLILTFGSISGAHFNPAVTLADASQGGLAWRRSPPISLRKSSVLSWGWHLLILCLSCRCSLPLSTHAMRFATVSECVATFGLLAVIWGCVRQRASAVPFAVGVLTSRRLLVYRLALVCQPRSNPRPCSQ